MNITTFATCERMALESKPPQKMRGPAPVPVGRHVGQCVFLRLTNPEGYKIEKPDAMTFDRRTRFEHPDVGLQVHDMTEAAKKALAEAGETIIEAAAEPSDAYFITSKDMVRVAGVGTTLSRRALILLVTSDNIGARWLLAGQKAQEYAEETSQRNYITHVGILHVPRPHPLKSATATLDIRRNDDVADAYLPWWSRVDEVLDGKPARPVPGHHCRRCYVTDCAVRTI